MAPALFRLERRGDPASALHRGGCPLVYAREHGFETWDDLTSRVNLLASNPATATTEPFMAAFAALQVRRCGWLRSFAAHASPPGRRARNKWQHAAESRRQFRRQVGLERRPVSHRRHCWPQAPTLTRRNDRGWTPLHAAAYANQPEIAALLIEKGAALDAEAHGAGGTPLIAALFWGHREVADLLGRHSLAPSNLRAAAGLGHPGVGGCVFQPRWRAHSRSLRRPRLLSSA